MRNNNTNHVEKQFNYDAEFVPDEPPEIAESGFYSMELQPPEPGEALFRVVEQQARPERRERTQKADQQEKPRVEALGTIGMADIEAIPEPKWMVKGLLQEKTVSLLYGETGAGKTFIVLSLAFAIAYGYETWMGRRVKQGGVLYIYAEGESGLKKRRAAYKEHFKVEKDSDQIRFITQPVDLRKKEANLRATIEALPTFPAFVVIDTFSMCAPGVDENQSWAVEEVIAVARRIKDDYGCHVMIVHHVNKGKDFRGSTAFTSNVDTVIEAVLSSDDATSVQLKGGKHKEEDRSKADTWLKLKQVELWKDEDGEVVTSCVVVPSSPEDRVAGLSPTKQKLLDALDQHVMLTNSDWIEASGISKNSFNPALRDLVKDGIVVKEGDGKGARYRRRYTGAA